MKRLIKVIMWSTVTLTVGGYSNLFAEEGFPVGWFDADFEGEPALAELMDSLHAPVILRLFRSADVNLIADDANLLPFLETPYKTAYGSGGYFSQTFALLDKYPLEWDYDSLGFWKDLADQLSDSLFKSADELHAYGFITNHDDNCSHNHTRRARSGIKYLVEQLKTSDYKTIAYTYSHQGPLFDTLDNNDGLGLDYFTNIHHGRRLKTEPEPDDPEFNNELFQDSLSDMIMGAKDRCAAAQKHNMEFWSNTTINNYEFRYPTKTELWAMVNLCLLYGVKGFINYFYNVNWDNPLSKGAGVISEDNKPYMTEDQCRAVFGSDSANHHFYDDSHTIYYDVWCVADTLLKVGPTFRQLYARDGTSVKENDYLENYFYIDRIDAEIEGMSSSEIYFEVGIFSDPVEGKKYFMIVNRMCSPTDEANYTIKLKLPDGTYDVRDMYTGWWVGMGLETDEDGIIEFSHTLAPGHAGLFRVDPIIPQTQANLSVNYDKATAYCNGRKIAVDHRGRIHICYTDLISGEYSVWYAYSDDGGIYWIRQKIATDAYCPTIAVDSAGVPYIAYGKSTDSYPYTYVWSEGMAYPKISHSGPYPTIDVYPTKNLGIVYNNSDYAGGMYLKYRRFNLDDLGHFPHCTDHDYGYPEIIYRPSCCFSNSGDAVSIARNINPPHLNDLAQMVNEDPAGENSIHFHTYAGTYIEPSLSRQGEELWATFIDNNPPTNNIKKRAATPRGGDYQFGDASTIIPNANVTTLQMANDWPLLVVQKKDGNDDKIYYSCMGDNWTALQRITTTQESGQGVQERYPHVFASESRHSVYFLYTESEGGNTYVRIKAIQFEDVGTETGPFNENLYVTIPAGGETWTGGTSKTIKWKTSEDLNPTSFTIKFKEAGSEEWRIVEGAQSLTGGNKTEWSYTWPHAGKDDEEEYIEETSICNIMVVANTGSGQFSDVSLPFTIKILWNELPYSPGIASCGGSGTEIPSSGNDPSQPEPLGYLPSNEEETIPWEGQGFYSFDTSILQFSANQGNSFTSVCGGLPLDSAVLDTSFSDTDTTCLWYYVGTVDWTIPSDPTSGGYLRLMGVDTTYDTVYSDPIGPFCIPPPGGYEYNTYSNQGIISLNDAGRKIGLVYTAQDPDTADKLSVVYMESDEGLGFAAPDTVGPGRWPSFSEGACFWQNVHDPFIYHPDTLFYSYQLRDTFATPYPFMAMSFDADSGGFAPVGFVSENDTVHAIIKGKLATHQGTPPYDVAYYSLVTLYVRFPEALPETYVTDTLQYSISTSAAGYNMVGYAPSIVKRDSVIYCAYNDIFYCCFTTITPSGYTTTNIGQGSQPSVSCSEGNITYTYLGSGDTSLIRLWRYLDDTTWVECDTFYLDDEAEVFCGEEGLMYGVQREDTSLANLYIYEVLGEEFYLHETYHGYYPHPYIDDESNELHWITTYTDRVDYETYYLTTDRRGLSALLPALYQEADDKRSPYTIFRDTCIHYASVDVDSAADSLIYRFPHLDSCNNYSLIVEFYTECDSTTQLQITVGSTVDTIQIAANSYSWYDTDVSSGTDTLNLAIRRISQFGFVPVSRVIVWRPNEAESYIMGEGGPQSAGPVQIPFCLYQPFPNPFADAATIRYSLPYATHVSLKIYDVSGRLVSKLVDGEVAPGVHELYWAGKDGVNRRCASGVYFVRFTAGDYQASKKMVLIK